VVVGIEVAEAMPLRALLPCYQEVRAMLVSLEDFLRQLVAVVVRLA
jgi:hypothetical protein